MDTCKATHDALMAAECAIMGWASLIEPIGVGYRARIDRLQYWALHVNDAAHGAMKLARDQFYQEQATKEDIMNEEQNEATEQSEKRQKFLRVAPGRVDKAVNAMRLLGQCANMDSYSYTEAEVQAITETLNNELDKIDRLFRDYRGTTKFRF